MAIKKKFLKTKPVCKVTFAIEKPEAKNAFLIGDFNNWDETATPLKRLKNGTFKTTLDLETEKSYAFRYKIDETWENDPEADTNVACSFAGEDNGVLDLNN